MKKRLLSILLALCMVLTLLPGAALAEEPEAEETGQTEETAEPQDEEAAEPEAGETEPVQAEETAEPQDEETETPLAEEAGSEETPAAVEVDSEESELIPLAAEEDLKTDSTEEANPVTPLAANIIDSGTQGDNFIWTMDDEGTLTFTGSGALEGRNPYYIGSMSGSPIKKVVIEEGATSIGDAMFEFCDNLTSVELPETLRSIGEWAFAHCENLSRINIPENVTSIGELAFIYCAITSINIPGNVTSIGYGTFIGCSLTSVTISEGVESIAESMFSGCWNLTSVTIPESVTSVGMGAFSDCVSLSNVTYLGTPEQWRDITIELEDDEDDYRVYRDYGNYPLYANTIHCDGGYIEPSTSIMTGGICADSDDLTWTLDVNKTMTVSGTGEWVSYTATPDSGIEWFYFPPSYIHRLVIEEGAASIGEYAFWNCENLTSVTLPKSLTSIGEYAFSNCPSISEVHYSGTLDQWILVDIGPGNEVLTEKVSFSSEPTYAAIPDGVIGTPYLWDSWIDGGGGFELGPEEDFSKRTVEVVQGRLPGGLQLNLNMPYGNVVSLKVDGTPTEAGTWKFVCRYRSFDSSGEEIGGIKYWHLSLTILGEQEETEEPDILVTGFQNYPYSTQVDAGPKKGETTSYTVTKGRLPEGLELNEETGAITGTPTESGWFEFSILRRGWFADPHEAEETVLRFQLQIIPGTGIGEGDPGAWPAQLPDGTQYVPYSSWAQSYDVHTVHVLPEPGDYGPEEMPSLVWEGLRDVYFPNLPYYVDDIYIDGEYVPISRERNAWLIIYARGFRSYGGYGTHTLTINLLDGGTYNLRYTIKEASAPEPNGYTYKVGGSNPLPQGLTLEPTTGEIKGVPMFSGTWNFQVIITDPNGGKETKDCSITIKSRSYVNLEDNDYEITRPVGNQDPYDSNHFLKDSYSSETLIINGPFKDFVALYLDGEALTLNKDYTARNGSTVITIRSQTFRNAREGTHTISAEFRENRDPNAPLKQVAQNYTLSIASGGSGGGGSGSSSDSSKSSTKAAANKAESQQPAALPFTDVLPTDWFYQDLLWAYENGFFSGYADGTFKPQRSISQATIVTVLARMAKIDLTRFTGEEENGIASGQQFTEAAIWAKRSGLLPEEGTFTGEETTTRNQMAVMLVKYLQSVGKDVAVPETPVVFADEADMSPEGNNAFQALYHNGIFKGTGGLNMNPTGSTTRAHFVALIHRIYDAAMSDD